MMPVTPILRDAIVENLRDKLPQVIVKSNEDEDGNTHDVTFKVEYYFGGQLAISHVMESNENIRPAAAITFPSSSIPFRDFIGYNYEDKDDPVQDYVPGDVNVDHYLNFQNLTKDYTITPTWPHISEIRIHTRKPTDTTTRLLVELLQDDKVIAKKAKNAYEISNTDDPADIGLTVFRFDGQGVAIDRNRPLILRFTGLEYGAATNYGIDIAENSADEAIVYTYYDGPDEILATVNHVKMHLDVMCADKQLNSTPGEAYEVSSERVCGRIIDEILRLAMSTWNEAFDGLQFDYAGTTTEKVRYLPKENPTKRISHFSVDLMMIHSIVVKIPYELVKVDVTANIV